VQTDIAMKKKISTGNVPGGGSVEPRAGIHEDAHRSEGVSEQGHQEKKTHYTRRFQRRAVFSTCCRGTQTQLAKKRGNIIGNRGEEQKMSLEMVRTRLDTTATTLRSGRESLLLVF